MVRKYLAPPGTMVIDYTRAHADDVFHRMWVSNSMSAKKDYAYRAFREWSLCRRGVEELALTANEIKGALKWAKSEVHKCMTDMDQAQESWMKSYLGDLLVRAISRLDKWRTVLGNTLNHLRTYRFDAALDMDPEVVQQPWA